MNETTFEQALKSAMEPIAERSALDNKIDAKLKRATSIVRTRRWGVTLGAAAAVVMSVFIFPRAQAQPTFAQLAGALDDVKVVRMERFLISEDGERTLAGRIDYRNGRWNMVMPGGEEETLWFDGDFYFLDKKAGTYVHSLRPLGPFGVNKRGMRLSLLLEPGGGLDGKDVTLKRAVFKGKEVVIATIEDMNLGERTVIRADVKSLLPIFSEHYSLQQGSWLLRIEATFDYSPNFPEGHFDLKPGLPVVSADDAKDDLAAELTAAELATIDIKGGRLVVRSVDVARDGTVFVTYQVGHTTRRSRGRRLTVTDDLGNMYAPSLSLMSVENEVLQRSPDGQIQGEVLVPLVPDKTWRPRRVRLWMRFSPDREPVSFTSGISYRSDGSESFQYFTKTEGVDRDNLPPLEEIWSGAFNEPSCEWRPDIFSRIQYSEFSHDLTAQLFRATSLARYYQNNEDWKQAEQWIEEELRLMRRLEEQGFGPYSRDDALKRLDAVQQHLRKPRSSD